MLRFVLVAFLALALGCVLLQVVRAARASNVDWGGVAFAIGFVAFAFYLRHTIELPGIG